MELDRIEFHQYDGTIFQVTSIDYIDKRMIVFNLEKVDGKIIDGRFALTANLKFFYKNIELDPLELLKLDFFMLKDKKIEVVDYKSPEADTKINALVKLIPTRSKDVN